MTRREERSGGEERKERTDHSTRRIVSLDLQKFRKDAWKVRLASFQILISHRRSINRGGNLAAAV